MNIKGKATISMLCIVFAMSCGSVRTIKFKEGRGDQQVKYLMDVPKGYELFVVTGGHERELRFVYPDSSVIYITNDDKSGGAVNTVKAKEYGEGIYLKILSSDTLDISGNDAGKYWREQKENKVVIGYINVQPGLKEKYDKVLTTLRIKE